MGQLHGENSFEYGALQHRDTSKDELLLVTELSGNIHTFNLPIVTHQETPLFRCPNQFEAAMVDF